MHCLPHTMTINYQLAFGVDVPEFNCSRKSIWSMIHHVCWRRRTVYNISQLSFMKSYEYLFDRPYCCWKLINNFPCMLKIIYYPRPLQQPNIDAGHDWNEHTIDILLTTRRSAIGRDLIVCRQATTAHNSHQPVQKTTHQHDGQ